MPSNAPRMSGNDSLMMPVVSPQRAMGTTSPLNNTTATSYSSLSFLGPPRSKATATHRQDATDGFASTTYTTSFAGPKSLSKAARVPKPKSTMAELLCTNADDRTFQGVATTFSSFTNPSRPVNKESKSKSAVQKRVGSRAEGGIGQPPKQLSPTRLKFNWSWK